MRAGNSSSTGVARMESTWSLPACRTLQGLGRGGPVPARPGTLLEAGWVADCYRWDQNSVVQTVRASRRGGRRRWDRAGVAHLGRK